MITLTKDKLRAIFPNVKPATCELYVKAFNEVFPQFGFNTEKRIAAFLGQVGVESGELRYDKELPSVYNKKNTGDSLEPVGSLYEGRANLGNIHPGDGPKYIGRGILQLTGRSNYESMSKKLGIDLTNNPDLACDAVVSTKIACQYFKDRNLLTLADNWDIETITEKVNGKLKLHLDLRRTYSERALKALNAP